MTKKHLAADTAPMGPLSEAACGWIGVDIVAPSDVTCDMCLDVMTGDTVVVRSEHAARMAEEESREARPRRYEWRSMKHALEWYAENAGRAHGTKSVEETLKKIHDIGAKVDGGPVASREPHGTGRIDSIVEIEKAMAYAFRSPYGLGHGVPLCAAVLLDSVVGKLETYTGSGDGKQYTHNAPRLDEAIAELREVPIDDVRHVARRGRLRVAADLAARGLIREPRGPRDQIELESRKRELRKRNHRK